MNKTRKRSISIGIAIILQVFSPDVLSESSIIRLGNYVIPAAIVQALDDGMTVPLYLHYKENADNKDNQKIANATIYLKNNKLMIKDVNIEEEENSAQLSKNTQEILSGLTSRYFSEKTEIKLSDDATLTLNVKSFNLLLVVSRSALSTAIIPRSTQLADSSVEGISSTLNYDLGIYHNQSNSGYSRTDNFLSMDNIISWKEHHLNFNGSVYGMATGEQKSQLYRAMYEKDYQGHRLALGMVDTWNLQSVGNISTLSSSKIYGFSYGNKGSTKVENKALSLTPITVFLPSAGEVHIKRDGRLLSIQNFKMGSYEVDTSTLPYGIYDVDVEVVANGKVLSSTHQRINKSFANNSNSIKESAWQIFGGAMNFDKFAKESSRDNPYIPKNKSKNTYMAGISGAMTLPFMGGLSIRSSGYGFDKNLVNENDINLILLEGLNIGLQTMIANDSSWRSVVGISANLPDGFGSIWANREKSKVGSELPIYGSDNLSYGGTINLGRFFTNAGTITISHTKDSYSRYSSNNIDYSTTLMTGRYGSLGIRTGLQRYHYRDSESVMNQKFISLEFSLPLGNWISAGVSNQNGNTLANLSANKTFENSVISSAGLNASQAISGDKSDGNAFSTSGYATFDSKFSSGMISVTRPGAGQWNSNLTTRGTLAYSNKTLAASGKQQKSGIMVETGLQDKGTLAAKINGQFYPLDGKNNFIPLPAYNTYSIELMNDKNSKDSFVIAKGKMHKTTLYPGNVDVYKPEIKQLVTVFGRIKTETGQIVKNADIRNHIGKTTTDREGDFSMDVDKRYPVITLVTQENKVCEVDLNLSNARGVFWAGDVICSLQQVVANNNSMDKTS